MSRRFVAGLLAVFALGAGLVLTGCGTTPPPHSSTPVVHHHPSQSSPTAPSHPPSQSALGVPSGFPAPFHTALQAFQTTTPAWVGAVAPAATVVDQSGHVTTSGVSLTSAWHQWQTVPSRRAVLTLTLSRPLATGTNGGPGMPAVGVPTGQANLVTTTPNVALATGVVTAGHVAHPFTAVLARLAHGWVLVTWRWL